MTDQQRVDHSGFLADSKIALPELARFAAGTTFSHCQTVNPICMPARTALITGKYTHQIGTVAMSGDLDWRHSTFPRALQAAGYHTSLIGKLHVLQTWPWQTPLGEGLDLSALHARTRELGFDQVWEVAGKQLALRNTCDYGRHLESKGLLEAFRAYVDAAGPNDPKPDPAVLACDGKPWPFAEADHIDIVTADRIIAQIRHRPRNQPFFLWGSFCSPHKPFDPPQRFLDQVLPEEVDDFLPGTDGVLTLELKRVLWRLRRAYRATLLLIDEQVGRIWRVLKEEGIVDETVVIFTSDHGEMMGDHFRVQKSQPWRESITVPTAIVHPDYPTARVCASPVELTDLTATILDVAGLKAADALGSAFPLFNDRVPGRSLLPIVRGEKSAVRDFSFSECDGCWWCVQDASRKFIRWRLDDGRLRHALYDLENDPGEQLDLAARPEWRGEVDRLREVLDTVLAGTPAIQLRWANAYLQTPNDSQMLTREADGQSI